MEKGGGRRGLLPFPICVRTTYAKRVMEAVLYVFLRRNEYTVGTYLEQEKSPEEKVAAPILISAKIAGFTRSVEWPCNFAQGGGVRDKKNCFSF